MNWECLLRTVFRNSNQASLTVSVLMIIPCMSVHCVFQFAKLQNSFAHMSSSSPCGKPVRWMIVLRSNPGVCDPSMWDWKQLSDFSCDDTEAVLQHLFSIWTVPNGPKKTTWLRFGSFKDIEAALAGWLSWLELHPVHQKVVSLIPSQGMYLGGRFDSLSAHRLGVAQAPNWGHARGYQSMFLSLMVVFLPLFLPPFYSF